MLHRLLPSSPCTLLLYSYTISLMCNSCIAACNSTWNTCQLFSVCLILQYSFGSIHFAVCVHNLPHAWTVRYAPYLAQVITKLTQNTALSCSCCHVQSSPESPQQRRAGFYWQIQVLNSLSSLDLLTATKCGFNTKLIMTMDATSFRLQFRGGWNHRKYFNSWISS